MQGNFVSAKATQTPSEIVLTVENLQLALSSESKNLSCYIYTHFLRRQKDLQI